MASQNSTRTGLVDAKNLWILSIAYIQVPNVTSIML